MSIMNEVEEKILYQLLERKNNVFLSGRSGAGKTYTTLRIINYLTEKGKKFAVGASTGIAGRNLHDSAKTIHSLMGLGIISDLEEYKIKKRTPDGKMADLISSLDVLIIEEISMLSANFMDVLFFHLKRYNFKGTILAIGDFKQLPPVVRQEEYDPNYYFAFQSKGWLFYTVFLEGVKRTDNEDFIEWSNMIRNADSEGLLDDPKFIQFLEDSAEVEVDETYVKLFSTNNEVDVENDTQLSLVDGEERNYVGLFNLTDMAPRLHNFKWLKEEDFWKNVIPLKDTKLKVGCRVMTTVNCPEGRYVNGDIGTVVDFVFSASELTHLPLVQIDSTGDEILIHNHTYQFEERIGGSYEVVATIKQLPLRLAYAITIHKSQGLTLDRMLIDASKFFLPAQFYVAWTRSGNPDNLAVRNFSLSTLRSTMELQHLVDWFYNEAYLFQNDLLDNDETLSARSVC